MALYPDGLLHEEELHMETSERKECRPRCNLEQTWSDSCNRSNLGPPEHEEECQQAPIKRQVLLVISDFRSKLIKVIA